MRCPGLCWVRAGLAAFARTTCPPRGLWSLVDASLYASRPPLVVSPVSISSVCCCCFFSFLFFLVSPSWPFLSPLVASPKAWSLRARRAGLPSPYPARIDPPGRVGNRTRPGARAGQGLARATSVKVHHPRRQSGHDGQPNKRHDHPRRSTPWRRRPPRILHVFLSALGPPARSTDPFLWVV